jgi:uncharacterized protein Smg (DUF494 family)
MYFTIKFLILIMITTSVSGCASGGFQNNFSDLSDDPTAFRQCSASQGNQQAQYELGLEAFNSGDIDTALKWLNRAAQSRPHSFPVYIPSGNSGFYMPVKTSNGTSENEALNYCLLKFMKKDLVLKLMKRKRVLLKIIRMV